MICAVFMLLSDAGDFCIKDGVYCAERSGGGKLCVDRLLFWRQKRGYFFMHFSHTFIWKTFPMKLCVSAVLATKRGSYGNFSR